MTKKINISEVTVTAPIPRELRLAVVADLHDREGERVAEMVLACHPDACLLAGDLFETPPRRSYYRYDEAITLLRRLAPRMPVFYAPGNHDFTMPPAVSEEMDKCGVIRLIDSHLTWEGILIGGIASAQYTGKVPNLAFLRSFASLDGYKLLIAHHPEYFRYIRPLGIDLTVAGHAHGGQWRIFGRGVFSPGQGLFPRYTEGLYENRLLVSRGLKISRPIPRIRNPREVVILTLAPTT